MRASRLRLLAVGFLVFSLACDSREPAERGAEPGPTVAVTLEIPAVPAASQAAPTATATATPPPTATPTPVPTATPLPPSAWLGAGELAADEVFRLDGGTPRRAPLAEARDAGEVVVDLSDRWAPLLLSHSDYRDTYLALASDEADPDEILFRSRVGRDAVLSGVAAELRAEGEGELSKEERRALERAERWLRSRRRPNYLEVYGVPPTLSVLARRVAHDLGRSCFRDVDLAAIRALDEEIAYQSHDQARRDHERTIAESAADGEASRRARARLAAVRAVQARLACEDLLGGKFTEGSFDHATHTALAAFEKKNHVFGWGFVAGETKDALVRDPLELHLETFRRILAERVADAAGILEDGSSDATWADRDGSRRPVPNLIGDAVAALEGALGIGTPGELVRFLAERGPRGFASLRVAIRPPPLPPYYGPRMDLSAEIDRGDVWYDPPFDAAGNPVAQPRRRFPHFTLFVSWNGQKIPLVRWRTTIGSWRSERGEDGQVYLKYKNSDVGPRILKHLVAAPVWIPPESTPARELLTRKVFDPRQGPVTVVNTEVIGPGFASAYGLGMAIHLRELPDGRLHDNLIRTHGSVDYTSIARRFSHGCHRLVNNRAVRLFGFLLRHREHRALGERRLDGYRRRFDHEGRAYRFELASRGYYYELVPPVPIVVTEGTIRSEAKKPNTAFLKKPGVVYAAPAEPTPPAAEPLAVR